MATDSGLLTARRECLATSPHYSSSLQPHINTVQYTPSSIHKFTNNDYTVGWICALDIELAASQAMFDESHPYLPQAGGDSNTYTLGCIVRHNVVLACLPSGTTSTNPAATVATNMLRSFPKIRFSLMVGVGGGAPGNPSDDPYEDLRLGDVVVSNPEGACGKRVLLNRQISELTTDRRRDSIRFWQNNGERKIYSDRGVKQAAHCVTDRSYETKGIAYP